MHKPSAISFTKTQRQGKPIKLIVVAHQATTNNIPSTSNSNRDGSIHVPQNLKIRNFRKGEDKAELMPSVFRARSYNQDRDPDLKQPKFIDPQFKEKSKAIANLVDEIVQSKSKKIYSVQHMRPKSNFSIQNSNTKPEIRKVPVRPSVEKDTYAFDAFQSYKFLKPLKESRTMYENNTDNGGGVFPEETAFTSPDANLRQSFPLTAAAAANGQSDPQQAKHSREHPRSANYSFDQNDSSFNGKDKDNFTSNDGSFRRALEVKAQGDNIQQPAQNGYGSPSSRTGIAEDVYIQGRKVENQVVFNAYFPSPERMGQAKEFKIQSQTSPARKYKIRPPTSPTHSISQQAQTTQKVNNTPDLVENSNGLQQQSQPQQADSTVMSTTNENYINILNSRIRKSGQSQITSSPLKQKRDEKGSQPTEKSKIAEIKQLVLTTECLNNRTVDKFRPSNGFNEEVVDNSLQDEDLSQDLEDFPYEEEEEVDDSCPTTRTLNKKVLLLESVYIGRPPTVFFPYPTCCEQVRDVTRSYVASTEEEKVYELKYKAPSILCVTRTFEAAGFKKTGGSAWNVLWGKPKYDRVKDMNKYQKTNHFPGCWEVGRKDGLWRNLSRMKRQFPNDYTFIPSTYLLSTDYDRFLQVKDNAENKAIWIMKPCASACGRGIKLINKKTKLAKKKDYLVSEYISNPHLIDGLKYDLRVYVLVSSFDPLRIYLYQEGLVRFATEKYSITKKNLKERFAHLTNWSVNKQSTNFVKNQTADRDGEGSKWSFSALKVKFAQMGIDYDGIFEKIKDIIIKTMIGVEPLMLNSLNRTPEHRNNCFELYGFDVLLDSNLKPWLMEVNVCPSLNSSTPLDKKIKTSLICDIMNLIGIQPYPKKRTEEDNKRRLFGQDNRKHVARNYNEMYDLDETNCIEKLTVDDWNILFDTDEEWHRRGNFTRIFPIRENAHVYAKYFEYPRYNNLIIAQWLKAKTNFLEKITPKKTSLSV